MSDLTIEVTEIQTNTFLVAGSSLAAAAVSHGIRLRFAMVRVSVQEREKGGSKARVKIEVQLSKTTCSFMS